MRVAFVGSVSESTAPRGVAAFWVRLRELGWIEGDNLVKETRWAEGRAERLPALMAEMVGQQVDMLVTFGTPAATAARNATETIPIVVLGMADPVTSGLVESLARPGGNLTGLSAAWDESFAGKWLELLQEIVPHLTTLAVLRHAANPLSIQVSRAVEALAPRRGLKLRFFDAADDMVASVQKAGRQSQALLVLSDPVTFVARRNIASLAVKYRLPTMFPLREFVDDGGLMSYGSDSAALGRRGAEYADKILRGMRPGELPIEEPRQFILVVNERTARALRLEIPQSVLLRADEVLH
jgi:ABC-type uncharacterized transport system substrate-binding protein